MAISYSNLTYTDNKLAVLLFRLSYPDRNEPLYWQRWVNQPLHQFVLNIVKGLAQFRQRILRLKHEQEFVKKQFRQLETTTLIHEDITKIRKFLHREYLTLLRTERRELDKQMEFLVEQFDLISEAIDKQESVQEKEWQDLFKDQLKKTIAEMKKRGLDSEINELRERFES